jgi:hypothetical protein
MKKGTCGEASIGVNATPEKLYELVADPHG